MESIITVHHRAVAGKIAQGNIAYGGVGAQDEPAGRLRERNVLVNFSGIAAVTAQIKHSRQSGILHTYVNTDLCQIQQTAKFQVFFRSVVTSKGEALSGAYRLFSARYWPLPSMPGMTGDAKEAPSSKTITGQ